MPDQPEAFVLASGVESKPMELGAMHAAGRVVITAADGRTLYISSFKIGNKDMNSSGTGPGEPLSNYLNGEFAFGEGKTVTLRLRSTGNAEQHVQVGVRVG